ncbi:30S ribosomal protein S18 [Mycoplasma bradburyae]|uniref:Small ribosomal subunit protein bS18 n=1 Tax=Mycoplasma bradburyae TaxID=2963128 RepID=A0ABT5G9X7_9MOLU|nr:30S ribosomal protein S18 [Mycoplasma bradburyae]MDC4162982.1 30S ribosomal protein S18 [Mycoplasma bradburyae]MDC4181593.1 30S ribosomal protein S18 [Mycoplasma bradburyae]MDC4182319.1 30S ribosomal protein S18 [Mycoplasma bradburyae]MDC4183764.1 30S ribosomal protein S18 [Mycoplasma bradburyae]UTS69984.1 30S ribosomal protein S18 [Mycoplasma bradburyae]
MSDITKQPANNISEDKKTPTQKSNQKSNFENNKKKFFYKNKSRKLCHFCAKGILKVDYKDVATLRKNINSYAKIVSRRQSGNCNLHQRHVSNAIKRARIVALLPFVKE